MNRFYRGYSTGNREEIRAIMAEDVEATFVGRADLRGVDELERFLVKTMNALDDRTFVISEILVDGADTAVIWSETATTEDGRRYTNHGVDVIRVADGRIRYLKVTNDITGHRAHFGRSRED